MGNETNLTFFSFVLHLVSLAHRMPLQRPHARPSRPAFLGRKGRANTSAQTMRRSATTALNSRWRRRAVRRPCTRHCDLEPERHSCARQARTPCPAPDPKIPIKQPRPWPVRRACAARALERELPPLHSLIRE